MKRITLAVLFLIVTIYGCNTQKETNTNIFLAQGTMSGEPTESSIILQSRLTATDSLVSGDVPGKSGIGRFEIADNERFENSHYSDWLTVEGNSLQGKNTFIDCTMEKIKMM